MKSKLYIHLNIPSDLNLIEKIENSAEKAAEKMNFSQEDTDNLAIAVTEAVNNAIIHGNKKKTDKNVDIKFFLDVKKITVIIKDEGRGFNPEQLDNPLSPENLLKESGRGIFILRALMDEVNFSMTDNGTEIRIVKKKK